MISLIWQVGFSLCERYKLGLDKRSYELGYQMLPLQ